VDSGEAEDRRDDDRPPVPERVAAATADCAAWQSYSPETLTSRGATIEGVQRSSPDERPEYPPAAILDDGRTGQATSVDVWSRPADTADMEVVIRHEAPPDGGEVDTAAWASHAPADVKEQAARVEAARQHSIESARQAVEEALRLSAIEQDVPPPGHQESFPQPARGEVEYDVGGHGEGDDAGPDAPEARGEHPAQWERLRDYREREPEWDLVDPAIRDVDDTTSEAQQPPDVWVRSINGPGMDSAGRDNNCVDCARAVESTWRGSPEVAARLGNADGTGTSPERITEWAGGELTPADYGEIKSRLEALGPGSSAIVISDWAGPFGGRHAYNALNDRGHVVMVDGQAGVSEGWPPTLQWSEADVANSVAVFFDREGTITRRHADE